MRRSLRTGVCVLGLTWATAGALRAELLEDFEGLAPGALHGQSGWVTGSSMASVVRDYTRSGDQVLRLSGADSTTYRALGDLAIPNGQTSTLFLRFRTGAGSYDHGIGLSDVAAPANWGGFEVTTLLSHAGSSVTPSARSGGAYVPLSTGVGALDPGTWYDLWIVVDNSADRADYYLRGGAITDQLLVGQGFGFRNGSAGNAITTFQAQIGNARATLLLDDIHLTPGVALTAPAPAKPAPKLDTAAIDSIYSLAAQKLSATGAALPLGQYPEKTAPTGEWIATNKWTEGFYPGQLWQMYGRTGNESWRAAAEAWTHELASKQYSTASHDIGFQLMSSYGQGYALTGSEAYRQVLLNGANSLAQRYVPSAGVIRSLKGMAEPEVQVLIDNMMNLELLFWAADNGGSAELHDIALQHAYTTVREHVRADGSTYHHVDFDLASGEAIRHYTNQGYADDSTWTRGQAWAIYGFTMAYRFSDDPQMLATARKTADYFLDHLPADYIPPIDFDAPVGTPKDTSAAAVAASALLELMEYVDQTAAARYFEAAEQILLNLAGPNYLSDASPFASLLTDGSVLYRNSDSHYLGLIYGDYYFLEALSRYEALSVPEPATAGLATAALLLARRRRRPSLC